MCDLWCLFVCLFVCHSVCHSVSRITAKVISRFHWNLLLWLGLPIRITGYRNFWWWSAIVRRRIQDHFFIILSPCRIPDFRRFNSISHTVISRFLRYLAIWLTPTREWIHNEHCASDLADIRIPFQIDPEIRIRIPDHCCSRLGHWRRFAYNLILQVQTMDHCPVFHVPHVALEQRRSTGGMEARSQLPSGSVQMTGRVCIPHGSASQICSSTHTHARARTCWRHSYRHLRSHRICQERRIRDFHNRSVG